MTLTILDPVPALVVIDLQKGLMAIPTVHPIEEVVARLLAWPVPFAGISSPSSWSMPPEGLPVASKPTGRPAPISPRHPTGPISSTSWTPSPTITW